MAGMSFRSSGKEPGARTQESGSETANGRGGDTALVQSVSLGRMKRLKLIAPAARIRALPVRPFAVSPIRLLTPGSWILAPFVAGPPALSDNQISI